MWSKRGIAPQHVVKKGNPFDPSRAAVPLAPTTCPEKEKKKRARARHGLRVPWQLVKIEFEASCFGTWERLPRACFTYTPVWPKNTGGIPPFDHFP